MRIVITVENNDRFMVSFLPDNRDSHVQESAIIMPFIVIKTDQRKRDDSDHSE